MCLRARPEGIQRARAAVDGGSSKVPASLGEEGAQAAGRARGALRQEGAFPRIPGWGTEDSPGAPGAAPQLPLWGVRETRTAKRCAGFWTEVGRRARGRRGGTGFERSSGGRPPTALGPPRRRSRGRQGRWPQALCKSRIAISTNQRGAPALFLLMGVHGTPPSRCLGKRGAAWGRGAGPAQDLPDVDHGGGPPSPALQIPLECLPSG